LELVFWRGKWILSSKHNKKSTGKLEDMGKREGRQGEAGDVLWAVIYDALC
jgi:hypothetical protein